MTFTVELAGVPVQVSCHCEENGLFLRNYLTDRDPVVSVAPSAEDSARVRCELEEMAERHGSPKEEMTEAFLENNAIHQLVAECLWPFGVIVFHGSALCMDGKAVIFTAPSGTGKSTQARLWREMFGDRVWMINDDKPLLRAGRGSVLVYGSPWDGKHRLSRNASAPLRAVVQVDRSLENRIVPLAPVDAFQVLVRQAFIPKDPAGAKQVLALLQAMQAQAAFYALACNMTQDAARLAYREVFGP